MGLFSKVLGKDKKDEPESTQQAEDTLETPAVSENAAGDGAGDAQQPAGRDDEPESWELEARRLSEEGRQALEGGDYEHAVTILLESLKIYEAHEDESDALFVSQYLGAALYQHGRQEEAVNVWEEVISRGWEGRPVYEWLIDHYEEIDRKHDADRVRLLLDSIGA